MNKRWNIMVALAVAAARVQTVTGFQGISPLASSGSAAVANTIARSATRIVNAQSRTATTHLFSTDSAADSKQQQKKKRDGDNAKLSDDVPLYRTQGIFAVEKPLEWTSSDVVSYIRGILERDARNRGARTVRPGSRRNKSRIVKVGHGGTLDPLAYGVLVIGVGKGTKQLQQYLTGPKRYSTTAELGYETTTLDREGNITKTAPYDHVTADAIHESLADFRGEIMQIPPIFSAIRKDGKKLYKSAREGKTTDDIKIDARPVHVYSISAGGHEDPDTIELPKFDLDIECGGGTFVRSLVRDIAYAVDSVATTVRLQRTKQGIFTPEDCLTRDQWSPDEIFDAIDRCTTKLEDAAAAADSEA